jgi:hypothetical protein
MKFVIYKSRYLKDAGITVFGEVFENFLQNATFICRIKEIKPQMKAGFL